MTNPQDKDQDKDKDKDKPQNQNQTFDTLLTTFTVLAPYKAREVAIKEFARLYNALEHMCNLTYQTLLNSPNLSSAERDQLMLALEVGYWAIGLEIPDHVREKLEQNG